MFGRAKRVLVNTLCRASYNTGDSLVTVSRTGRQVVVGGCAQEMSRRPAGPPALFIKMLPGCGHGPASPLLPEGLVKKADP